MLRRLTAAHRLCPKFSCAGVARSFTHLPQPIPLLSQQLSTRSSAEVCVAYHRPSCFRRFSSGRDDESAPGFAASSAEPATTWSTNVIDVPHPYSSFRNPFDEHHADDSDESQPSRTRRRLGRANRPLAEGHRRSIIYGVRLRCAGRRNVGIKTYKKLLVVPKHSTARPSTLTRLYFLGTRQRHHQFAKHARICRIIHVSLRQRNGMRPRRRHSWTRGRRYLRTRQGGDSCNPEPELPSGADRLKKNFIHWNAISQSLGDSLRGGSAAAESTLQAYREHSPMHMADDAGRQISNLHSDAEIMAIMAGSLATSARQTLDALDRFQFQLQFQVWADCCFHLRRTPHLWEEVSKSSEMFHSFSHHVNRMKAPQFWPSAHLRTRYLNIMVEFSTSPEACEILAQFEDRYPNLSNETLLRLVGHYTELQEVDRALDALSRVSPSILQSPNPSCVGLCVNLLLLDRVEGSYSSHSFRILPRMLQLGLPPLEIIHNMVVQNAARSSRVQVAFDLLYYLQSEKIRVHSHTYSTLLKHSFLSKDTEAIDKLFTIFQGDEALQRNPWLMASTMNIVRSICFFERMQGPEACFQRVIQVYDRAWSREPLKKFGILVEDFSVDDAAKSKDVHPVALAGTIWSYILVQRDPQRVLHVWRQLTQLLEAADPLAVRLVQEVPSAFRAFLVFFARQQHRSLDTALVVLDYLLVHYPNSLGEMEWAIILAGFVRAGGSDMAEKLRKIMMSTGRVFTMPGLEFLQSKWSRSELVQRLLDDVDARGLLPRSAMDVHTAMAEVVDQLSVAREIDEDVEPPVETAPRAAMNGLFEDEDSEDRYM